MGGVFLLLALLSSCCFDWPLATHGGCDLRRVFVATQAVSLGPMVAASVQFRWTSAGGW